VQVELCVHERAVQRAGASWLVSSLPLAGLLVLIARRAATLLSPRWAAVQLAGHRTGIPAVRSQLRAASRIATSLPRYERPAIPPSDASSSSPRLAGRARLGHAHVEPAMVRIPQ